MAHPVTSRFVDYLPSNLLASIDAICEALG
jgi:hypothetical protein